MKLIVHVIVKYGEKEQVEERKVYNNGVIQVTKINKKRLNFNQWNVHFQQKKNYSSMPSGTMYLKIKNCLYAYAKTLINKQYQKQKWTNV